jgi:hypothetical protein
MAKTHRLSITGALIVCVVGSHWNGTLFASEADGSSSEARSSQTLTKNASEMRTFTSQGLDPSISIDEDSVAATEVSFVTPTAMERSRFAFKNEVFAANPPMASRIHRGNSDWRGGLYNRRGGFWCMPTALSTGSTSSRPAVAMVRR